ncbi:ABC transporter ATP-binding protein [Actinoplanes sp. OR16]|uniref:ABC transporter ATP-binding protein n=1 Tax=Actinoplanes sp. OR16 TaxID=946334 RepID=UPI000F70BD3E|nr:ABC transporter ATP-binding protein [Actinoplanes sp. OR16]BBH71763.1 ABC transporter ATP-binding protein [Actinoplanes sp. OR16]
MSDVLTLTGITAGYAGIPAVRDLDLSVASGEIVAMLGPNGAGKTTTLLTAAGVITPMSGVVTAFGKPLHRRLEQNARAGLVLVPDTRGVFHTLSVRENLALAGGDPGEALDLFPALKGLMSRRCGRLSGGEQQMLAIAKALVRRPRVLLIDEMSMGLAPVAVQALLPSIRALADRLGVGVLLVEQHIDLALSIADRAVVLHHGRVSLTGPAAELRADRHAVADAYFGG